jgi:ornithine cyclodeaminase/alanine dehydrogenase-like protein (mu-crystallin family)
MPADALLYMLNADAVSRYLEPDDVMAAVREAFILHAGRQGRVFPVIREPLATGGIFGIKAGDVQSEGLLGFKAAGFWPANRGAGGEPHQATIMLVDPATGRPVCILDGNAITTARTAAAGALGIQALARADSTRLCVFGTGVQARAQAEYALRTLPGIRRLRYVSRDRGPDQRFEAYFGDRVVVECADDPDEAVSHSDIVITATPGRGPLFDAAAVRPGTHVNCVGADTRGKRELPGGLLERVRLVVDDVAQARQIGEAQWAPDVPCEEIGDVLAVHARVDRQPGDITVFDLTGLALQDLTVARRIHARARADGAGMAIPWPW